MRELGLVALLLAALVGVPAAVRFASWELVFGSGLALIALGLLVGVPTGAWYHVALYRALAPRRALGRLWWLRPTAFHDALLPAERPPVMRWFRAGAVGFVLAIVGCVLFGLGAAAGR